MSGSVLVTGAAGFIGDALITRLEASGRSVVGTDLRAGRHPTIGMDVTDRDAVHETFERQRPRFVVHCAAVVDDRVDYATTARVNVEGTRNVLDAASSVGVVRFVHVSSIAALGLDPSEGADETSPLRPDTGAAYFDTKAVSERLVRDAMGSGPMEIVVVRPGDVFGPGSVPWVERPLELMRTGVPVLIGGGRGRMAHAWIENLIDGLILALEHDAAPSGIFTFHDGGEKGDRGSEYATYFRLLAEAAGFEPPRSMPRSVALVAAGLAEVGGRLVGRAPPLTRPAVRYVTRGATYSLRAARESLGYAPRVSLRSAMSELANQL